MEPEDPVDRIVAWHDAAVAAGVSEPSAMTLATCTPDGRPSARVVLFRGVQAGQICFFTNYESRKGRELAANAHVALVMFWSTLGRQIRVEGVATKLSPEASNAYFQSRPRGHQLGAWVSPQSRPIADEEDLIARQIEVAQRFDGRGVPRPEHWGGYGVRATGIEFWTAGVDRLHHRVRFDRTDGPWQMQRLAP